MLQSCISAATNVYELYMHSVKQHALICRLSAYWLGWSPTTFYRIYTAQAFVLFTLRWALYRIKKWHYYLFDFCYVANVLLLLHLWVFPHSAFLHKVTPSSLLLSRSVIILA